MLAMTVLLECEVEIRKNSIALPVKQRFVYPRCCGLGDAIRDAWTILGTRRTRQDHEQTGQEQKMKKCATDAFLMDVCFAVHESDPLFWFSFLVFLVTAKEWHETDHCYVFDKMGFSYVGYAAIRGWARTACSGGHIQIDPRT
jgi:hypothetical protein